jgi:hypothetical protein
METQMAKVALSTLSVRCACVILQEGFGGERRRPLTSSGIIVTIVKTKRDLGPEWFLKDWTWNRARKRREKPTSPTRASNGHMPRVAESTRSSLSSARHAWSQFAFDPQLVLSLKILELE